MRVTRGDVWVVDFGRPVGHEQGLRRPAVVVSSDMLNDGPGGVVIVVPVTTARRDLPLHVELEPNGTGLRDISYAKAEDVRSISIERLQRRLGHVDPVTMERLVHVLRLVLEI